MMVRFDFYVEGLARFAEQRQRAVTAVLGQRSPSPGGTRRLGGNKSESMAESIPKEFGWQEVCKELMP